MSSLFKWINILFSIVLVLIAAGIAYVAIPYFGNQALIVRSGSMAPAIDVGSIVVVRPSKELISPIASIPMYNIGNIIAFRSEKNSKTIITHRIVGFETKGNDIFYKTKGDANKTVDGWLVGEKNILGKTYFTLPYAGNLLAFAKSDFGFPLLIIIPAVFVILLEIYNIIKEIRKNMKSSAHGFRFEEFRPGNHSLGIFKILTPFLILGFAIPITFAFSSDTEKSTNNLFAAAEVFSTTIPSLTPSPTPSPSPSPTSTPTEINPGDVVINEINWGGSNGDGNDEWVELRNTTSNDISLANWVVENLGTGSGGGANVTIASSSATIPANGFFLISALPKSGSRINVDSDYVQSSISLNNGGEQLRLKTNLNILIDTANATSGAWFNGANSTPKKTMERKTPPGDGAVSGNWQTAATHTGMDGLGSTDEFGTPKGTNGL